MKISYFIKKSLSVLCCFAIVFFLFAGCNKTGENSEINELTTYASFASPDETTVQPTAFQYAQLSLEELDYPTIKLDISIDWESLFYEHLRSLNNGKYYECALMYINNDDIPELYIKTKQKDYHDFLCFITEDGLTLDSIEIDDSEGFWYLEKQYKVFINDVQKDQFADSDTSNSPTKLHNRIFRDASIYYFTGNTFNKCYSLSRSVVDGRNNSTNEEDDGGYDYYDGEKDIPVNNVDAAIKSFFDVKKAKSPDLVLIDSLMDQLKDKRKAPHIKAEEYYGDPTNLVYTYKDTSKSIDYYDGERLLSYRIPQINLNGEDIKVINQEILDELLNDANLIEDGEEKTRFINVDYESYINNGILSLVIDKKGWGGTSSPDDKTVYTIDITSEKKISNLCLLNSYGLDCLYVSNTFSKQVKADYDDIKNDSEHPINLPDSGYDKLTIDDLFNGTMEKFSPVGVHNKMYFDNDGNLNILYLYEWIAGSRFYEKTMTISKENLG